MQLWGNLSITELKNCASKNEAIFDFEIFGSDWQNSRTTMNHLFSEIESNQLPIRVVRFNEYSDNSIEEQELTVKEAREALEEIRGISIEQDMLSQLEAGHISTPAQDEPDEDV